MALITCPECGKEISEHCTSCPSCGYPMKEVAVQKKHSKETLKQSIDRLCDRIKGKIGKKEITIFLSSVALLVIFLLLWLLLRNPLVGKSYYYCLNSHERYKITFERNTVELSHLVYKDFALSPSGMLLDDDESTEETFDYTYSVINRLECKGKNYRFAQSVADDTDCIEFDSKFMGLSKSWGGIERDTAVSYTNTTSESSMENQLEAIAVNALYDEIVEKSCNRNLEPASTTYSIASIDEGPSAYIVYGNGYFYDKYGKLCTMYSDGSGSYSFTFEVRISKGSLEAVNCSLDW